MTSPDRPDVRSLSFTVNGYPPAKNEATSLLAAGHSHYSRVVLLLQAAQAAALEQQISTFGAVELGLEVVIRSPGRPPADATNFLGGIGDVLESKGRRGSLDHLGELAGFSLYQNDGQIQHVVYRVESDAQASYTVRLWELG